MNERVNRNQPEADCFANSKRISTTTTESFDRPASKNNAIDRRLHFVSTTYSLMVCQIPEESLWQNVRLPQHRNPAIRKRKLNSSAKIRRKIYKEQKKPPTRALLVTQNTRNRSLWKRNKRKVAELVLVYLKHVLM